MKVFHSATQKSCSKGWEKRKLYRKGRTEGGKIIINKIVIYIYIFDLSIHAEENILLPSNDKVFKLFIRKIFFFVAEKVAKCLREKLKSFFL